MNDLSHAQAVGFTTAEAVVYVGYVRRDASGFGQIYVARSTNEGATWTSARVTDGSHHAAYPEIAVTKRGVVGVLYVDFDDSGPATIFRHRFARSFTRGQTWSDRILQSMDPGPLVNAASGFLWGDYEGLTAARNTFYGVFTGASDGRATPQLDPMFFRQKSCRWWSLSCWSNPSSSPRLSAPRGAVWRATMKSIPWAAARRAFLGAAALTSALVLGTGCALLKSRVAVPQNGCTPGPYAVGQVDYNFEDEFDLVPSGGGPAAYPNVDVRATVRYPATAAGVGQPVAGLPVVVRFPLVAVLHGNHVTCSNPCSGSHSCAPADRVPNHRGYDYLLDILASWGFIAVSIDGFDVTAAFSPLMSDYEGRGRLVLRHLAKWQAWDASPTDPWGGLFHRRVDMDRIGLSGHSRGGEGVVAAEFINRAEGLGFRIRAVNAIAPTDQDPLIHYVPQVPYFLLMAASDGDVSNLQGLRTYDRTSLAGAATQSEKSMLWVYGANHNFFNTAWTPGLGTACALDDGTGEGRLSASTQRHVACQSIVPFFRLHLQDRRRFRKLLRGEVVVEGLDGLRMYWSYQDPIRREVDNFDSGDDRTTNSLGEPVTTSGGFTTFDEFEFKSSGPDLFNASFRHFTHGLVLGWNSTQTYETTLPAGQRDISGYRALALRVGQILDGGVLNRLDTPRTFRVALRTGSGVVANAGFDVAGLQTVPFPYEYNGGKTVLTTIRIPLKIFRAAGRALPLDDIQSVMLEFRDSGLIAVDDIQFTK